MNRFDVVFPLKLGPLTYKSEVDIEPGSLVDAQIKQTLVKGIALRQSSAHHSGRLKAIDRVVGQEPLFGVPMLRLLEWMSEYYFAVQGIVLKEMAGDYLDKVKDIPVPAEIPLRGGETLTHEMSRVIYASASKRYYKTYLLRSPDSGYSKEIVGEIAASCKNVIIVCPDIASADDAARAMAPRLGERLAVYHSGLRKTERAKAVERALSGEADVIVGSRSVVFFPLKGVSAIAVMGEESPAYKKEEGLLYNARDVAVMRGYLEGATVLLSSICPSVESYYNAKRGKYELISPHGAMPGKIRVIDMRTSKKASRFISKALFDKAKSAISSGKKVAFFVNRKGHSMLECEDCGFMEHCPACGMPLMLYKADGELRCGTCGKAGPAPETCPKCKSARLSSVSAGIERVEEEIKELFGIQPMRLEKKKGKREGAISLVGEGMVVGTKLLIRRPELRERFSVIGVLNADRYLSLPDFRALERAFQEMAHMAERLDSGGEMIIQSRLPHVFRRVRARDFEGFCEDELAGRRELGYPPFSKAALVALQAKTPPEIKGLKEGVEALGPVWHVGKKGKGVWKIFLKADSKDALRGAVKAFLRRYPSASVEIDP